MLIGKGAEAEIHRHTDTVVKKRIIKGYRHKDIDTRIRKERNRREARIMKKVSRVIDVPRIDDVSEYSITMEFIEGTKLKSIQNIERFSEELGKIIGSLHSEGFFHGDLTTSNMILRNGKTVLIDFGLADRGRLEDFATDIKVLFESAEATHTGFSRTKFFRGYSKTMEKEKDVRIRLDTVYSRGRYLKRPQ